MWDGQQFLDEKYSGTALNKIILNYKCFIFICNDVQDLHCKNDTRTWEKE